MKTTDLKYNAVYDDKNGKPLKLQRDNDGSWIVRYNIEQYVDEDGVTFWRCREIRMWSIPDENLVKKEIITSVYDQNEELKLINDFNRNQLGMEAPVDCIQRYVEFLQFVQDVNAIVSDIFSDSN